MLVGKPRIRIKRSTVSGETPTFINTDDLSQYSATTQITSGEFFLNTVDQRLWVGVSGTTMELGKTSGSTGDFLALTGGTLTGELTYEPYGVAANDYDILVSSGGTLHYTDFLDLDPPNNTVIAGTGHSISSSINSGVFVGASNTIDTSDYSGIFAGSGNTIADLGASVFFSRNYIFGGLRNLIDHSGTIGSDGVILGGADNSISSTSGTTSLNAVVGGQFNNIGDAIRSGIFAGEFHDIQNQVDWSAIVGGRSSFISDSTYSAIVGGDDVTIDGGNRLGAFIVNSGYLGGSQSSVVLGGETGRVSGASNFSAVIGGLNNSIDGNSSYSAILGGRNNTITNGVLFYSALIGGIDNAIDGAYRSVVIGGQNLTATTDDTVVVPYLHVNDYMDLEPRSAAPTAVEGRMYYNSTKNKAQIYDGTTWQDLW